MNDNVTLKGARWWKEVGWKHILAVILMLYCIFPLLYVLSASLNPGGTISGSSELFRNVSLENYATLFGTNFPRWMLQSFVVSTATAIGTVLMAASAAYAFSRYRFTGRRGGLTTLMLIQMFPQMLAFVAIFLLLLMLRDVYPVLGLNSALGLIAVYLGGALGGNTFLIYGFFNTIPKELDEAARIDGATHAQIFWGSSCDWSPRFLWSSACCPSSAATESSFSPRSCCNSRRTTPWRSACTCGPPMNETPRGRCSLRARWSRPSRSSCCSCTCRSTSSPD